jgi:hypothetical protein
MEVSEEWESGKVYLSPINLSAPEPRQDMSQGDPN